MTKKLMITTLALGVVLLGGVVHALADDDMLLAQNALHLDYKAEKTGWPTVVFDQLKNEFNVSEARLFDLREKNLSYAEISTVLSLAEQMPGGINDKNIQKVVTMRRGDGYEIGWGNVAKALKVQMARAVEHAQAINYAAWTGAGSARAELETKNVKHPWGDEKLTSTQLQVAPPRLEDIRHDKF
jgi:hypothetical protein